MERPDQTERLKIEDTLKRCPFCGTQATMLDNRISCDHCLCDLGRSNGESDAELAERWNARVNVPSPGRYAEMEVELRALVSFCEESGYDCERARALLSLSGYEKLHNKSAS